MKFDSDILKRPAVWGSLLSVIAIAVIAAAFFFPDAMEGNLLRQPDMQQGQAIGHETQLYEEATGEKSHWTNSLFGGMPTFQISPTYPSNSLFAWINHIYGLFLPAPASWLAMMMLGFFILLLTMRMRWYTALIGAVAYGFSSYFIILIGAGHIWKFITLAYIPPTVAGMLLCYRGRYLAGGAMAALFTMLQTAANHVQMSYYFIIVMAVLALALLWQAWRSKRMRRWCMATAVMVMAGLLGVTANLPSIYNTYEYSKETIRGHHSELTPADHDGGATATVKSGLDKDYILQYSYGPSESWTLLIPNVKGGASAKPVNGQMTALTVGQLPEAESMYATGQLSVQDAQNLQAFPQYFGEPEGTNGPVYVGALIVALFLLGCFIVRGPLKWGLVLLTLLSLLLALGRNCEWLSDLFINYFPMYNKFRTVESILVIAEFTMPLLAMMALHRLITASQDERKAMLRPLVISFGFCAFICALGTLSPSIFGSFIGAGEQEYVNQGYLTQYPSLFAAVEQLRMGMVRSDSFRSLFIILIGACAIWMYIKQKAPLGAVIAIIGVVTLVDLYTVGKRYVDHESFCTPQLSAAEPFQPTVADRKIMADTTANFKVMNIPQFMQPAPSYFYKNLGGYHAAKLTRYQDMLERHLMRVAQVGYHPELRNDSLALALTGGNAEMMRDLQADLRILDMLNARYIVVSADSIVRNDNALGQAWLVDKISFVDGADAEMAALDTLDPATEAVADARFRTMLDNPGHLAPGDAITATSYAPNRLTYNVNTANGALAVFPEIYFPWGWNATVDGEEVPVGRVNYLLRAIKVPAGTHTLTMEFNPSSLRVTNTLAIIAIIIIYAAAAAAIVITLRRREKENN